VKNKFSTSLKSKKVINNLFETGKKIFTKDFTFIYLPNEANINRYVICVSKKNFKKAVCRNKIKRQIRNMIEFDKVGHDIAIMVKGTYDVNKFSENMKSINNNLGKIL